MAIDAEALKKLLAAGGEKVLGMIKAGAKDFLKENVLENDFLRESGKKLFELGLELADAQDEAERARIMDRIEVVKDGMTSELWSLAVDATAQTRSFIKGVVETARNAAIELLPIAVKVIRGLI